DNVVVTSNTTAPDANAGPNMVITCAHSTINLAGSSATPNATYSWGGTGIAGGANTPTPAVNAGGAYTLTVTDPANGCTATSSTNVTVAVVPTLNAVLVNNPCPQIA